ncbi:MAG: ferrochelatase [Myxococcales bacterium]|nr:ferrochelatase [Myxococcales bacterium]MDH3482668.1 ferrochelatase [Myxococcales bacterium]
MSARAIESRVSTLDEVQARIDATTWGALTLDPCRSEATPLKNLVASLAGPSEVELLAAAAIEVASAQLDNFPENLFWDFDCYLASVHAHAAASPDYAAYVERTTLMTVGLMQLYGQQSKIRFRYVHDFMYGFDWARWVRRDPANRLRVDPFGLSFLNQSESRGRDILGLIEADDSWYPRLGDGVARNPFSFSREPEDELVLYRDLSARDLVPVQAWRIDAAPDWSRDFDALREARAKALKLVD